MSRSTSLESRRVYAVLLVLSLTTAAWAAADKADDATNEDLKPKSKDVKGSYKNTTGAGHHYGNQNGGYGNNNGGYGNDGGYGGNYGNGGGYGGGNAGYGAGGYGGGYGTGGGGYGNGGGGYGGGGYGQPPIHDYNHHLVDDYVCDVDASILVVTNSENAQKYDNKDYKKGGDKDNYGKKDQGAYGGSSGSYGSGSGYGGQHNNYGPHGGYVKHAIAHRLRCSVVAIHNDSACTTCCQLAARRDKSIAKERIIGFIIDNNQVHLANAYRKKRDTAQPPAPPPSTAPSGGNSYGGDQKYGKDGGNYGGGYTRPELPVFPPLNPRCVCCAPKHHYDNHYIGDYGKSDYGNGGGYGNENYGHGGNGGSYGQHPGGYAAPPAVPYGGDSNYGNQYQPPANYGGNDNAYGPPPPPPAYGNNGGYAAPSNPPAGGSYGHEQPNYHAPPPPPAQYSAPYKH